jgi:hypothetical protein
MYTKYHLVALRRTLVALGFSLRRRDTFEPFSILQILRRRRRSTGVHLYCPYAVTRAAPLGSALSDASLVRSSYALRRRTYVSIPLISALEGTQQGFSRRSPGRSRPRELGRYEIKRQPYGRTRQPEG